MIITKESNLLTNKVTFTVELDRPADYSGIDVYPDERLADLLMAIALKMKKDCGNRKIRSNAYKCYR